MAKTLAIFCIKFSFMVLHKVEFRFSEFVAWLHGRQTKELDDSVEGNRMTEGGKCAKKYINASDFISLVRTIYSMGKVVVPRALSLTHRFHIRNRIEIQEEQRPKKKSNWKTCMRQTQSVSCIEWYSRLCTQSHSAEKALVLTPQPHTVLYIERCVWTEKGLLYIDCRWYRYREVYRIEYIDRLYIFLVNRYWLSATQSNQTVRDAYTPTQRSIESNLCIGSGKCVLCYW